MKVQSILNKKNFIYFIKTLFFICCYISFCAIVVQLGIKVTKAAIVFVEYIIKYFK